MKTIIKLFFLFSFFFSLFSAHAQAPEKMSYQAVIRNASNTLITNQAIGMRVSILQGSATGTEVYKELFNPNPQTNINGLLTIEIGSGLPITGTFAGINWANGPFFIKTETDPSGGTSYSIVGTSQLLSSPYALYAKNSGNVWGLNGNVAASTNFIGTTNDIDLVFKRNNSIAGRISENNTSIGFNSLNPTSSGDSNTAIGVESMLSNTAGYRNTSTGFGSLRSNTSGFENTSIGYASLYYNTTGNSNTASGFNALNSNTTGSGNTASGKNALFLNISGLSNTAMGNEALYSNTIGDFNTANGTGTLRSNTTGSYNNAIGLNSLYSNTTGGNNTANGAFALLNNTIGTNNTAFGYSALSNFFTGSNNTGIGNGANVPSNTGSNQVRIGNTAITYAGTQVAWSITSDRRWKENIQLSNLGLNFINDLKPVFYTRKNDETKKVEYGIIAQELEASLQKFGADTNGIITKDDESMYSVRYNDLLAPMIKAIQEQQVMIDDLKAELQTLKNKK
jgi:hypothetical protein